MNYEKIQSDLETQIIEINEILKIFHQNIYKRFKEDNELEKYSNRKELIDKIQIFVSSVEFSLSIIKENLEKINEKNLALLDYICYLDKQIKTLELNNKLQKEIYEAMLSHNKNQIINP